MNLNFINNPKELVQIDNCRIIFKNLSGAPTPFNPRGGERTFSVVIPNQDIADRLIAKGYNVKIKPPREEGDEPFMHLPVKVAFNDYGPNVYLDTNGRMNKLTEETVGILDNIEIRTVDLDIRPYDWNVRGDSGRSAYLSTMRVVQNIDRFAAMYAENEFPEE